MRILLTGATGMVGEGVLHECLTDSRVSHVLVLSRKATGMSHPKMAELLHSDFLDLSPIAAQLTGFDACFFCLGISSVGVHADRYLRMTYTLTLNAARVMAQASPGMCFCYVSGQGTDENSRMQWAQVKGRTERELLDMAADKGGPLGQVFCFRPGYLHPTPGLKNTLKPYRYLSWLYPVLRPVFPGGLGTLRELGQAMLAVCQNGYPEKILDVKAIRAAPQYVPAANR